MKTWLKMHAVLVAAVLAYGANPSWSQEPADPAAWAAAVERNAPAQPTAAARSGQPRKVLVFSLATGYQHSVTPYVDQVFTILGKKSGALAATISRDLADLSAESLRGYDVLALNNTCSVGPRRDLLLDVLETDPRYKDLTEDQRRARAKEFEQGLLAFVHGGKGLVVIHGAPTLLNKSPEFTRMVGGSFDYHPPCQKVTLRAVNAEHPLAAAFRDAVPFTYEDEPYCFDGPYEQREFRPLLAWDNQGLTDPAGRFDDEPRYAAWIKSHGQGRVFFCSPGHVPDAYTQAPLLQFLLDGTQYAAGDLPCDDTPVGR